MRYALIVFLVVACSGEQKPTAPAGKATDDDCALCDFLGAFNDQQEAESDDGSEEEGDAEEAEEDDQQEEEAETDSTSSEGGPDLIVQSPAVSALTLAPGQTFTLHATVQNQGDAQAAATTLHYYRSNNSTITASDTEVGTDAIGPLDASATSAASIELTAPTGGAPGVYYGACVASVSGESNTDNNCSSAVRITVSGQVATEEKEDETTQDGTDGDIASGDDEADEDTAIAIRLLTHSGRGPRWSSDGQRIVFYSSRNGWWDIYSIDADGTNEIRLTTHETGEWAPTWSPDGGRIAFVSTRDGYDSIHIMDSDGTNETRLTENYSQDGPPAWSPDGRRIAYVSSHRINNRESREIYVMDADGFNKKASRDMLMTGCRSGTRRRGLPIVNELRFYLYAIPLLRSMSWTPMVPTRKDLRRTIEVLIQLGPLMVQGLPTVHCIRLTMVYMRSMSWTPMVPTRKDSHGLKATISVQLGRLMGNVLPLYLSTMAIWRSMSWTLMGATRKDSHTALGTMVMCHPPLRGRLIPIIRESSLSEIGTKKYIS